MDCTAAQAILPLYLDGELSSPERGAFELHLEACAACRQAVETERALKSAIRALPRHAPPPGLTQRVRNALPRPTPARAPLPWYRSMPALAAGLALFLLGGVVGRLALAPPSGELAASRDVVAAHVRALVGDRVTDVASAEGHVVKPWFAGRVELAPAVANLNAEGFPLTGGRVDFVEGRRAATLVYKRRSHVIAVFVWPSAREPNGPAAVQGYNLRYWRASELNYAAISDLNPKELDEFAALFRARTAPPLGRN